jgi:mannose-6-phosphate isomerase-like protein (cupin superfamily)
MKVTIFIFFVLVPAYFSVSGQTVRSATDDGAKPVILEKNEGELRVRRRPLGADNVALPVPTSEFMLKISPKNNDSQHLVMGTEQIPPGGRIRTHRHLEQDEILIIQTGEAHVHLGVREADVHAGGTVFIPANTKIGLQNTGSEPISLVFIFSAPGFEDYMRCTSVPAGTQATPVGVEEMRKCAHEGHVIYDDLESAQQQ